LELTNRVNYGEVCGGEPAATLGIDYGLSRLHRLAAFGVQALEFLTQHGVEGNGAATASAFGGAVLALITASAAPWRDASGRIYLKPKE
jgi:hypothetical protein